MTTKTDFEYLIIGGGPAGLQLGYHLQQAGRDFAILEAGDTPGTFFKRYPRHRTLISINKVYTGNTDSELNMRWDWNSLLTDNHEMLFKDYTKRYFPDADIFVDYLQDYAKKFELPILCNVNVTRISKDTRFRLEDSRGNVYSCQYLIVAAGVTKPYIPEIPGIELTENYTAASVDPEAYINQRVLILGKGNSAFETADNLVETASMIHVASPNPLNLAWKTHFVGHLRAVNNNILDTYQLKSQNAILDATVTKIVKNEAGKYVVSFRYTHAHGEEEDIVYDRVLVCTGFRFDNSIFDEACRPEMAINERFPKQTSEWESTNVEDLYFAGTIMQMRDYKDTTSGFIHGFRYNVRALYHILERKYQYQEWPSTTVALTPEAMTDLVIERINRTSALWQQFGFLRDVLVISEGDAGATYYEELPRDYIVDTAFGQNEHYYTISLEYGTNHIAEDPFNVTRVSRDDVEQSHESNFLHPIVRRFSGSTLVAEHHVIEDLASEWDQEEHIQPLLRFFACELAKTEGKAMTAEEQPIQDTQQLVHA